MNEILLLLENIFNELQIIHKKYKKNWNYYELEKHRAKEDEIRLIYKKIKELTNI